MAAISEEQDLGDTRVSIFIPLTIIAGFAIAQLYLGTSPYVMALCAFGIAAPLLPLHIYGRDLYAIIGIIFSLRYAGVALMAKTAYGQPLEQNLFQPVHSFELYALLMAIVTLVLLIARRLDRGGTLFPFPTDLASLRRLSVISLSVGFAAQLVAGANAATQTGEANAGPLVIIAGNFASFFYLGLISEVIYGVTKSNGRSFMTPLLAVATGGTLLISMALNWREFFAAGMVALAMTAFMYKAIRPYHILGGVVIAYFFLTFLSPVTLYLRVQREGMPKAQFAALALSTFERAAVDPSFLEMIKNFELSNRFANFTDEEDYDYYGDRSGALNRFSYIMLLDAISSFSQGHTPIGWPALKQTAARVAPGFLGFDKRVSLYGLGDWLSWQVGIGNPGMSSFLNFGLPMEGLATWGLIGFITYPFIFLIPVLFIAGRISTFKVRLPLSIFLFTILQHSLVEGNSDFFVGAVLRELPQYAVLIFLLYYGCFLQSSKLKPIADPAAQD
ncbi:hypothetical protein [Methylocapsa palsarum]|uniref:Oligosaccharide repeat unit polymerase n=1 Tax=Methylocapsa palsarum TaxID=1612308 RepID=A0A1I4BV51_9HYPH|nr:hypothetical protein [Methylocapsa palsarum]SFK71801.1 hypothetical protein SAMN05444581_11664 [Methylocapsa palsarum]